MYQPKIEINPIDNEIWINFESERISINMIENQAPWFGKNTIILILNFFCCLVVVYFFNYNQQLQ
jgi:hypothetical protein